MSFAKEVKEIEKVVGKLSKPMRHTDKKSLLPLVKIYHTKALDLKDRNIKDFKAQTATANKLGKLISTLGGWEKTINEEGKTK